MLCHLLCVGAVYPTTTKDSPAMGLDKLAAICAASRIPVVAIGGITAANAAPALHAGAAGVAVVSALFGAADVRAAAAALRASVDAAMAR